MASASDIINIDIFDDNVATSSQQNSDVIKEPNAKIRAVNLFSQTAHISNLQTSLHNTFARRNIFF